MDSSRPGIGIVDLEQADLHLWVANQSPLDDPVLLTVEIDGTEIVSQPFEVRSQHHRLLFPLRIAPGGHRLRVTSDTGVTLRHEFTMPGTERQFAVIEYWNYADEDGRRITWQLSSRPTGLR